MGGTNATFTSLQGSIVVYGVDQTADMMGVTTTYVEARATNQQTTFTTSSSAFFQIHVDATGGIEIEQNPSSTDGFLHLVFNEGNLVVSADTTLEATNEDLVLDSSSAIIQVTEPAHLRATTDDLWLSREMQVTRGSDETKFLEIYVRGTLRGGKDLHGSPLNFGSHKVQAGVLTSM